MSREAYARAYELARAETKACQDIMDNAARQEFELVKQEEAEKNLHVGDRWLAEQWVARAIYWENRRKAVHAEALAACAKIYPGSKLPDFPYDSQRRLEQK